MESAETWCCKESVLISACFGETYGRKGNILPLDILVMILMWYKMNAKLHLIGVGGEHYVQIEIQLKRNK